MRIRLSPRAVLRISAFFVGFASLVYEVYGAKVLFLYVVETTHAVAVLLSAFLAGLAVSSLIVARYAAEESTRRWLCVLQVSAAAYGFAVLQRYDLIPRAFDGVHAIVAGDRLADTVNLVIAWLYLFFPGLFMGGAFPLLASLAEPSESSTVRNVGEVYFWDTFGAIAGALACGFVLLPWLGLERAIFAPMAVNLMVVALLAERRIWRVVAVTAAVAAAVLQWWKPNPSGISDLPPIDDFYMGKERFGHVIDRELSPFGTITVSTSAFGIAGNRALFVNYRDMCQTNDPRSEASLGERAVESLGPGARVLNIGLGCGFTAAAVVRDPDVSALDVAEINPVVVKMARRHFADVTDDVLNDPKVHVVVRDGAEVLRHTERPYDAIVIDIEEPTILHSSPLFTRDYFELAKQKLVPGGVLAMWVFGTGPDYAKVIANTLRAVFEHVEIRVAGLNLHYFASSAPLSIPAAEPREARALALVEASKVDDVNTIANRAIERYFRVSKAFGLPKDYTDSRERR